VNERDALRRLAADLSPAGDDAAVVDDTVITTDMLHERTDFPPGTTRYTAGWRAVGASLSDVAAMGAEATAAVAVYADERFDPDALDDFIAGATRPSTHRTSAATSTPTPSSRPRPPRSGRLLLTVSSVDRERPPVTPSVSPAGGVARRPHSVSSTGRQPRQPTKRTNSSSSPRGLEPATHSLRRPLR